MCPKFEDILDQVHKNSTVDGAEINPTLGGSDFILRILRMEGVSRRKVSKRRAMVPATDQEENAVDVNQAGQ